MGSDCVAASALLVLAAGMVVQPGDGSCLFHSLGYGMRGISGGGGSGCSASALRREIANFIARNADLEIAGKPAHLETIVLGSHAHTRISPHTLQALLWIARARVRPAPPRTCFPCRCPAAADSPLRDWVKWDSNSTVRSYTGKMAVRGWGGGIEMARPPTKPRLGLCGAHS